MSSQENQSSFRRKSWTLKIENKWLACEITVDRRHLFRRTWNHLEVDNWIPYVSLLGSKSSARQLEKWEHREQLKVRRVRYTPGVIFSSLRQISRRFCNIYSCGEFSPRWDIAPREIARERLDDVLPDDEHARGTALYMCESCAIWD